MNEPAHYDIERMERALDEHSYDVPDDLSAEEIIDLFDKLSNDIGANE